MARQATPEQRRAFLEAADGGPAKKTPPVFYAALAMTLIAIGVLLWL
jgi:hypothetical protein